MNVLIKMNENEVKVYAQEHHISIQEAYRALMLKNLEESYEIPEKVFKLSNLKEL